MLIKIGLLLNRVLGLPLGLKIMKVLDIQISQAMLFKMLLFGRGNKEEIKRFNKNVNNKICNMLQYLQSWIHYRLD
jgi:hypothetical protein